MSMSSEIRQGILSQFLEMDLKLRKVNWNLNLYHLVNLSNLSTASTGLGSFYSAYS